MKISKKKECENEIKRIRDIYFKAQEAFLVVKAFYNEDEQEDQYVYEKNMNSFFYYTRIVYWQITVIELSKLFIDNERFNIITFLKKLKVGGHFSSLKFDTEKIIDWEQRISNHVISIDNLKEQRNKVYAHDDLNNQNVTNQVSLEKVEDLLKICREIIGDIYNTFLQETLMFDLFNTPSDNLKFILSRLVKEQKISNEEHIKSLSNTAN